MQKRIFSIIFFSIFIFNLLFIPSVQANHLIGKNFQLICAEPCSFDEGYQRKFKRAVNIAYRWLKQITKTELPKEFSPIKIHLTQDAICNSLYPNSAYAIRTGNHKGTLCMQGIANFRYARALHGQLAHELAHFYFPSTDNDTLETIEHPLIRGIQDVILAPHRKSLGFCLNMFATHGSNMQILYPLCTQAGFDRDKIPAFLMELQNWRKEHSDARITKQDYADIMKKLLGGKKGDIAADIIMNFKPLTAPPTPTPAE